MTRFALFLTGKERHGRPLARFMSNISASSGNLMRVARRNRNHSLCFISNGSPNSGVIS